MSRKYHGSSNMWSYFFANEEVYCTVKCADKGDAWGLKVFVVYVTLDKKN